MFLERVSFHQTIKYPHEHVREPKAIRNIKYSIFFFFLHPPGEVSPDIKKEKKKKNRHHKIGVDKINFDKNKMRFKSEIS